jgi:hypothetical protein
MSFSPINPSLWHKKMHPQNIPKGRMHELILHKIEPPKKAISEIARIFVVLIIDHNKLLQVVNILKKLRRKHSAISCF